MVAQIIVENLIGQEQNNWIWLAVLFVSGMVVFSVDQKPFEQYKL